MNLSQEGSDFWPQQAIKIICLISAVQTSAMTENSVENNDNFMWLRYKN